MEENMHKQSDQQGINLQNIQKTLEAQYQKNKQPNQNMGKRSKQTLLQRRHTDGQTPPQNQNKNETHEKMLNNTNYYINENQNYNEVSSHTNQNGHH